MDIDFTPYFRKYESLVAVADSIFAKMKKEYPQAVTCGLGCADCCYALFDLSLIEAIYINDQFHRRFSGAQKENLLEKARIADRAVYKLKRQAFKALQKGKSEREIFEQIAEKRIRCPLLDDKSLCALYEYRPITCRIYGVPTSIDGKSHICGLSGFTKGQPYPTVQIDVIHRQLYAVSHELVQATRSRHVKMSDVLVPLSMAILTDYDEAYLGIGDPDGTKNDAGFEKA
jgi:Fe-S-cluster containining protein